MVIQLKLARLKKLIKMPNKLIAQKIHAEQLISLKTMQKSAKNYAKNKPKKTTTFTLFIPPNLQTFYPKNMSCLNN